MEPDVSDKSAKTGTAEGATVVGMSFGSFAHGGSLGTFQINGSLSLSRLKNHHKTVLAALLLRLAVVWCRLKPEGFCGAMSGLWSSFIV